MDAKEAVLKALADAGKPMRPGEIAEAAGVLKSGGSDYHGVNQPGIDLGSGNGSLAVPFEFLERMMEARQCAR